MDALDRRLVHALQLAPRAPWTSLAPLLGVDAVTLARRWERLRGSGAVYLTVVDSAADDLVIAFVELAMPVSAVPGAVAALVGDGPVTTVDRTSGERALMATVFAEDLPALGRWASSALPGIDGPVSVRPLVVTGLVADARAWRVRALRPAESTAVSGLAPVPSAGPRLRADERRAVVAALVDDVRMPASAVAARAGVSAGTAREAIAWLLASRALTVRVDVARVETEWPVYVWFFLAAPPAAIGEVTQQLRQLPQQRVVATTAGRCNVVMAAWLRASAEVHRLEGAILSRMPAVAVVDRAVVLGTVKHVGHVLDAAGRATGTVVPFVPVPSALS